MTQDNMNFTTGSIFRKLIGFMMPILGALLLQTMYGAVDILVVGWFGTDVGISAVSTGSSFINMIVFILNGLAMGVTVLMGRYIGEKERGKARKSDWWSDCNVPCNCGGDDGIASRLCAGALHCDAGTKGCHRQNHCVYSYLWWRYCIYYRI